MRKKFNEMGESKKLNRTYQFSKDTITSLEKLKKS